MHFVSLVVLVLDEIAVVVDTFVILVCVIETRTLVVAVVFSVETVGGCCYVRSCCVGTPCLIAYRDRLLQFSSASLEFLALRVMPYEAVFLHT